MQDRSVRPLIVGLLGGIASGKSRVAALLQERGAAVLDADRLAHEELQRPEVRDEVEAAFGPGVVGRDGGIDRGALGALVFENRPKLLALEAIVHPRVMARIAAEIERRGAAPGEARKVVALDAPLLVEAGGAGLCDEVLFVDAAPETRERRARERGWPPGELGRREARQVPLAEKRAGATAAIDNDGDLAATAAAVDRFWRERIAPRLATRG